MVTICGGSTVLTEEKSEWLKQHHNTEKYSNENLFVTEL